MSADSHDLHDLILKAYLCIQPVFVTFQIKNHFPIGKKTRVGISPLNITRRLPLRLFNFTKPSIDLTTNIRVFADELLKLFSAYDLHASSVSIVVPLAGGLLSSPHREHYTHKTPWWKGKLHLLSPDS